MTERIRALLGELKSGLEEIYGARLRGVYLYGSYARGEQEEESDVDVLIVLDQVPHYRGEIKRTSYLVAGMSGKYGVSVSRVFVPERDWGAGEIPFLLKVREEAVPALPDHRGPICQDQPVDSPRPAETGQRR
ncbi:MAG: nucleotidyltransferase domain-containing protein [Bryobacteraceae bacterium]|jgi:predicted nucleotidyltransferase